MKNAQFNIGEIAAFLKCGAMSGAEIRTLSRRLVHQSSTMKMKAESFHETFVRLYQNARRHDPEVALI